MAIAVVGATFSADVTTSSVSVPKPANLAVGDVMYAWEVSVPAVTSLAATGWAQVTAVQTFALLYWKRADAADVAASDFTFTIADVATDPYRVGIIAVRGAATSGTPHRTPVNTNTNTGASITGPAAGGYTAGDTTLQFWGVETDGAASGTESVAAPWTIAARSGYGTGWGKLRLAFATGGTTETAVWTNAGGGSKFAYAAALALIPAPVTPVVRVYEQAILSASGGTAAVRVYDQTVVTVPYVGDAPGPMWALRGGSWVPWRITQLTTTPGGDVGPGAGGGAPAVLLDGNMLSLDTQSMESGVAGWTAGQWAGDRFKDGNHSNLLVTGMDGIAATTTVTRFPVPPGDTVMAFYWAYTQIAGVEADITLTYYDASGNVVATDSGTQPLALTLSPTSLPTAVWTRTRLDSTAPANAATVTLTVRLSGPVSTQVHIDRAYLAAAQGAITDPEAIALRSTSTAAVDTGAGNLIMPLPAGTQSGDLLVFFYSSYYPVASVSFTPAGWTLAGAIPTSGDHYMGVYYKRATGSEPAAYTAALGTGQSAAGWMGAFTGAIASDPPVRALHPGSAVSAQTSATAPGASDTQAADFALHMATTHSNDPAAYTLTPPAGWTLAGDPLVAGADQWVPGVAAAVKLGATDATTWSADRAGGVDWVTASLAVIGQTSTPGGGSPPSAPTGLTAGTATSNSVPLSWDGVPGATGYKVYRDGTAVATPAGTTFSATGLSPSTTYSFTVTAVNQYGESPQSSAVSATTTASGTLPAAPAGLTVGAITSSSVALSWSAVTGATMYAVYRGSSQVATTTNLTYMATGLTASTPYTFQVSAINAVGEGAKSSSVSATTTSAGGSHTFFADRSPINTLIPTDATLDPDSATITAQLLTTKKPLLGYGSSNSRGGVPIYQADGSEPRYSVLPAYAEGGSSQLPGYKKDVWGDNFLAGYTIPWNPNWTIAGSPTQINDDKWVVIRDVNGNQFELWMTTFNFNGDGKLECWWGCRSDSNTTSGGVRPPAGRGTGANFSIIAGMITTEDWHAAVTRGYVDHALVFSSDSCAGNSDTSIDGSGLYRYPASSTDGPDGRPSPPYVMQGMRFRIDPSVTIPTTWPIYEQIVCRTLQMYGAYCIDKAGEGATLGCGRFPADGSLSEPTVRAEVGLPDYDWPPLDNIPWASALQLLSAATTPKPNPAYY